ncbi:hypothetical protein DFQ29_005227, partial [Apophysomyces sp. BC1021]
IGDQRPVKKTINNAADNMNDDDSVDLKHKFTLSFNKIEQQKKWILQPGKCVKDAIYAFGIKCTTEHFVIDPSDASYANCNVFTPKEMEEISDTNSKVHPQLPDELRHCINSFNKNNLLDIHRAVMAKQPWEMNYNKTTDNATLLFGKTVHVWRFIDTTYDFIDQIDVVRGESSSVSLATRRIVDRIVGSMEIMKYKKRGQKCDLILRSFATAGYITAVLAIIDEEDDDDGDKTTDFSWLLHCLKPPRPAHTMTAMPQ